MIEQQKAPGQGKRILQVRGGEGEGRSPLILLSLVGGADSGKRLHYDASVYHGIQFWIKANRLGRLLFLINTVYTIPVSRGGLCDGESYECDNGYSSRFEIGEEWALVRIPFDRFVQSGFPNDGPLDPRIIKELGFKMRQNSEYDFWIDDLSFY